MLKNQIMKNEDAKIVQKHKTLEQRHRFNMFIDRYDFKCFSLALSLFSGAQNQDVTDIIGENNQDKSVQLKSDSVVPMTEFLQVWKFIRKELIASINCDEANK